MGDRPAQPERAHDRRTRARSAPGPSAGREPTEGPVELHPAHRRRWLIGTLVAVVLAVATVVGGPWVYARLVAGPAAEPLVLSTPSPSATAQQPPATMDVDGQWQIGEGSEAGYRLGEVLTGAAVVVVGRTDVVNGTATVADGALTATRVVVDTASITTDESARDAYFRRALDTTSHPEAVFVLTEPVDVSAVGTSTQALTVTAAGTVTLRGVDVPSTATLQAQRTLAGVEVVGTVPVTLSDFGLEPPDLGFVTVEPTGTIEMRLVLVR